MKQSLPFHHPYRHDFVRVAVAVPRIRVADPAFNAEQTISMLEQAAAEGASLVALPGAGPLGLHLRRPVPPARAARRLRGGAGRVAEATARIAGDRRSSACRCASTTAVQLRGGRRAAAACSASCRRPTCRTTASSTRRASSAPPTARSSTEVDARRRRPCPSAPTCCSQADEPAAAASCTSRSARTSGCRSRRRRYAALAGATVLVNLSASNITIGKADYRHQLVASSRRAAWRPTSTRRPGIGESTTDLAWDGQALIYENGDLLAESRALRQRLALHRRRRRPRARLARAHAPDHASATRSQKHKSALGAFRTRRASSSPCRRSVPLGAAAQGRALPLRAGRSGAARRALREVYNIQVQALVQRLAASGIEQAGDRRLGRARLDPRAAGLRRRRWTGSACRAANILAYTMPGFATSDAHARPGARG